MSGRSKLFVGLGVLTAALFVVALWQLREDEQPKRETETTQRAQPGDSLRDEGPPPQRPTSLPERPPSAGEHTPAAEQRDGTGQLLSAGPAQVAQLPERPEGALDNVPNLEESADATSQVLDRLEAEIADAKAAGDTAMAERLEVRRARLERKQAEAIDFEAGPEPEPEVKPD